MPAVNNGVENEDVIEVITPGASRKQRAYNAFTNFPSYASVLSTFLSSGVFIKLNQNYASNGWFAIGALQTYTSGYKTALEKYASVIPSNYTPAEITIFMGMEPLLTDTVSLRLHKAAFGVLAIGDGLLLANALMNLLAKKNSEHGPKFPNAWKYYLSLTFLLTTLYALLGGFSELDNMGVYIFGEGEKYGGDYGAVDGQNYYCSSMNYTGPCPNPMAALEILQNNLPTQALMKSANETLLFILTLGIPLVAAPFCSAMITGTITGSKKVIDTCCRRNRFFAVVSQDPTPLLTNEAHRPATPSIV